MFSIPYTSYLPGPTTHSVYVCTVFNSKICTSAVAAAFVGRAVLRPPRLPETILVQSMRTSAIMLASRLPDWIGRSWDHDFAGHNNMAMDHAKTLYNTPLCDMLVARGVFPTRNARPWATLSAEEPTSTYQSLSRTGLHAAVFALPQSLITKEMPPFISFVDDHHGRASPANTMSTATRAKPTADSEHSKCNDWFKATRVSRALTAKTPVGRRRSFAAQYISSHGFRQYLSFLEDFRNVLLSCSTTLAAVSSEIAKRSKYNREAKGKEFREYFDVV